MKRHRPVEGTVLVLNQNQAANLVLLDKKAQPPPTGPLELRKIFEKSQAQRTAGNHHKIVIAIEIQAAIQKFLESRLKAIVPAVDD